MRAALPMSLSAGTDANVFVDIYGEDGASTGRLNLNKSGNNFERGSNDTFTVGWKPLTRTARHMPPSMRDASPIH